MFKVIINNDKKSEVFKKNLRKAIAIKYADVMTNKEAGVFCEVKDKNDKVVYSTKEEGKGCIN